MTNEEENIKVLKFQTLFMLLSGSLDKKITLWWWRWTTNKESRSDDDKLDMKFADDTDRPHSYETILEFIFSSVYASTLRDAIKLSWSRSSLERRSRLSFMNEIFHFSALHHHLMLSFWLKLSFRVMLLLLLAEFLHFNLHELSREHGELCLWCFFWWNCCDMKRQKEFPLWRRRSFWWWFMSFMLKALAGAMFTELKCENFELFCVTFSRDFRVHHRRETASSTTMMMMTSRPTIVGNPTPQSSSNITARTQRKSGGTNSNE